MKKLKNIVYHVVFNPFFGGVVINLVVLAFGGKPFGRLWWAINVPAVLGWTVLYAICPKPRREAP